MREIWMRRELSRSQIAKNLGLDKSTISNNINELLELGIIIETSEGAAGPQGGRKPIILKMNKGYGCVLGLELRPDNYTAVAVDLDGEILYSRFEKMKIKKENLNKDLIKIVKALSEELNKKGLKLLGVGLGISGVVNSIEGKLKYSIPFEIRDEYNICGEVAAEIDVPVFIDNDANACVWGELAFHRREDLRDCIFILLEYRDLKNDGDDEPAKDSVSVGVGVGLVINGNVHYGHDYSAGEFRSILRKDDSPGQFSLSCEEQERINEDPVVRKKFLKELCANTSLLVNTFNLTHIILGGEFERFGREVVDVLEDEIKKNWPYRYEYEQVKHIWFSSFGDKAVAYGAGGMVLNKLFCDLEIIEEYTGHLEVQSNAGII